MFKKPFVLTDMQESMMDLALLLVLSLILTFLVMASQFESMRMPFIIMFSIPFALIGVSVALVVTGQIVNVVVLIGGSSDASGRGSTMATTSTADTEASTRACTWPMRPNPTMASGIAELIWRIYFRLEALARVASAATL